MRTPTREEQRSIILKWEETGLGRTFGAAGTGAPTAISPGEF